MQLESDMKLTDFKSFAGTIGAFSGVLMIILGTHVARDYSYPVFVLSPICLGLISSLIYSRNTKRRLISLFSVSILGCFITGLAFLLFAFEGIICLVMALPLAMPLSMLGAFIAYLLQPYLYGKRHNSNIVLILAILISPIFMAFEKLNPNHPEIGEVNTSIEINASSEKVWQTLTAFPRVPKPKDIIFKSGISFPTGATIDKKCIGGTIKWQFNTGEVHELITNWQENKAIYYKITKETEMMKELSPYNIHPPHLDGYFKAEKGAFILEKIDNNKTKLIGLTTYQSNVWPSSYWMPQADYLHKKMQLMVMENIKKISEK